MDTLNPSACHERRLAARRRDSTQGQTMVQPNATVQPNAVAPSPDAVAATVVHLLPTLIRALVAEMHNAPHTAGMTLPQFRVLARLNERAYRAAELADALEVGRPTLTATVDGLERRGLVGRTREAPGDRRRVALSPPAPGEAVHPQPRERAPPRRHRVLGG